MDREKLECRDPEGFDVLDCCRVGETRISAPEFLRYAGEILGETLNVQLVEDRVIGADTRAWCDSEAIAKELEETLKQARGMGVSDPDELPNEEAFEILKPIIPEAFRSGLLKSMPTASNPGRTLLDSIPV